MKTYPIKPLVTVLILCLLAGFTTPLFAGVKQEKTSLETGKITVTDILGRKVTLEGPAKTVVWTNYSTPIVLKILNAWDKVIGGGPCVSDPSLYPGFEKIPRIISDVYHQYQPNMEVLIGLNPDLIILEVLPMPGLEEFLQKWGDIIPVVTVKATDFPHNMRTSYEILGKLLDREDEANAYTQWVGAIVDKLAKKSRSLLDNEKTSYFFKTSPGGVDQILTFSNEMSAFFIRDSIIGGINIAGNLPSRGGWIPSIDAEWIVEQDYDVLLVADAVHGGYGPRVGDSTLAARHRDAVMALPAFQNSRAVKEGRVYAMSEIFAGADVIMGMVYLAKIFHPKLYANLDPVAIHQEYYRKFFQADVNIAETGVFVYPAIR